jgi:uncharacterized membrane protein YfcA
MKYEVDSEHIKSILRTIGMAIFIGSVFYAALDNGDLKIALPLMFGGFISSIAGSIREKT